MKELVRKYIRQIIKESFLTENVTDVHDFFEILDSSVRESFGQIKTGVYDLDMDKIKPSMYRKALQEFTRFRAFHSFPTKYIIIWKNMVLENIAKLNAWTSIMGHTSSFPYEEFHDTFNYNEETDEEGEGEFKQWVEAQDMSMKEAEYDYDIITDFLVENYEWDDKFPTFSNGQLLLSDFGLGPLLELAMEMIPQQKPEDVIVSINKILDVAHQRSDLAELFIQGGSSSLDNVTYNQ